MCGKVYEMANSFYIVVKTFSGIILQVGHFECGKENSLKYRYKVLPHGL